MFFVRQIAVINGVLQNKRTKKNICLAIVIK